MRRLTWVPFALLALAGGFVAAQGFFPHLFESAGEPFLDWRRLLGLDDTEIDIHDIYFQGPEAQERIVPQPDLVRMFPDVVFRHGSSDRRQVALTFDDGPDDRFTPAVLDILAEARVPATFFLVGALAERYPEVTRRIAADGHDIGHHGYQHVDFSNLTDAEVRQQLARTATILTDLTGKQTHLFRPPYAALNPRVVEVIAEEGYKIILWSIDSLDWRQIPAEDVLDNVLPHLHPGAIVLFHSAGGDLSGMVQALPRIIAEITRQGLKFVTVRELLGFPSPVADR